MKRIRKDDRTPTLVGGGRHFIAGVVATEEAAAKLRVKEIFGFQITREELHSEWITLSVSKL